MPSNDDVAAAIDDAHDLIKTCGWCQGQLEDEQGAYCIQGALNTVTFNKGDNDYALMNASQLAVVKAIHPRWVSSSHIIRFNDDPKTTQEDVLDLLSLASKQLRNAP